MTLKNLTLLIFLLLHLMAKGQKVSDVTFYNGKTKLAATLFIPNQKGTHPAIAVTHGSGKEGRLDQGYISLASTLAKEGFVVLIYDKRGVGNSDGQYKEVPDLALPAGDLVEAVKYLQTRPEVNKNKIGVYGHSQGGWIAPMAAAFCSSISFVMVSCGGGVSIREQDLYSYRSEFKKKGYSTNTIDSIVNFGRLLYTYLATGIGYSTANASYEPAVKMPWFSFFKAMGFSEQLPPPSQLKEPVFNFFKAINYDPQSTLRELSVPALVLLASNDEIVPTEKCKQMWEDSFFAGGQKNNLSIVLLEGENHYDFERIGEKIVYKKSFSDAMIKWLKEKL